MTRSVWKGSFYRSLLVQAEKDQISKNPFIGFVNPFFFDHQVAKIRQGKKHCLVPIQGHKVQHLLITWGQIENFFSYFSLDS
jgi:hypothetical protein